MFLRQAEPPIARNRAWGTTAYSVRALSRIPERENKTTPIPYVCKGPVAPILT